MQPLVSIVILSWNRKNDLRESLEQIRKQKYGHLEVIVADNNSADGTQEMLENDFPEVKLIKMFKNIGIEAYNIGFENARGEYIVILDDDSYPEESSVGLMVEKFKNDSELGIVAFDVRNYYNYDQIKSGTDNSDLKDTLARAEKYLLGFNGAGAGVRRELFRQIGYYPEEFFLYWNEADTAFRVLDAGYKVEFFSDIISYHKYSPQNRASWRAPFYYTRNAFFLIWKHYPADLAIIKTLHLVHGCFLSSLEQKTLVYLKAMFAAFFGIATIRGKRKAVKRYIAETMRIPLHTNFTFYR